MTAELKPGFYGLWKIPEIPKRSLYGNPPNQGANVESELAGQTGK